MNAEQELRNEIDNYNDSLFAIIGFMNFYRFDDTSRKMREEVLLFQGRRLTPSVAKATNAKGETVEYVTPDLGILLPSGKGVLGEVKKSFPRDSEHWMDDFEQLMAYDDDLTGWPNESEKVSSHDVVLLLHETRAVAVRKFYEQKMGKEIRFIRPFSIVEFHRSSEGQEYFFFRSVTGGVSETALATRLELGISVPMTMYLLQYSTVKLYDAEPPMPYLLEMIWTHVVAFKVTNTSGYKMPNKKQKLNVEVSVAEISERLETLFSFHVLQHRHANDRQPKVLKDTWVQRACDALVKFGDGEWADATKTKLMVKFTKRDDVLEYFVKLCSEEPRRDDQMELFKERESGKR
ncbi:MAG: hypothetical protein ABSG80_04910 [Verrucomicrobiota bacterium]|jgi:hypothetical protein